MKVLHILKSEPDQMIEEFLEAFVDDEVETVRLYDGDTDWDDLVEKVFAYDKVIGWW